MEVVHAVVGIDVHKATISVVFADAGREGEVRHVGAAENIPAAIAKLVRRLGRRHGVLEFVYEADSCGYNVQRQIAGMGFAWRVCTPSRAPGSVLNSVYLSRPMRVSDTVTSYG